MAAAFPTLEVLVADLLRGSSARCAVFSLFALCGAQVGCVDQGFTQVSKSDLFQQGRLQTVDVLLVVDNSCSMVEEQNKLATNFDAFIQFFTDANVDWQIGVVTTDMYQEQFSGRLIGGDDEIILVDADGRAEDEVAWDKSWPVGPGVVFSLDPTYFTATSNDNMDHWCMDVAASPGVVNAGCGGTGTGADDLRGSVLISEFVPDPDGVDDSLGEWLELTNISDADVDLTGWGLVDAGRNAYSFPDGAMIAAGGTLVLGRSADSAVNGGIPVDLAFDDLFTLNNHDLFLTPETDDPAAVFSEMVAQGINGSGTEMGLQAAYTAVTEPMVSTENAGFLREDANLSVLIVSDEQDASPLPVDDYLNGLVAVKGEEAYRDHSRMNISAVVGDTPPEFEGQPSCSSRNGDAKYGSRYVYAVAATNGLMDSICAADFSPLVQELGLTLSGLQVDFALSRVPELDTLAVSLYADETDESKIGDLTLDADYSYIEETNSIHFEYDQIPDSQTYISVEYTIRSGT